MRRLLPLAAFLAAVLPAPAAVQLGIDRLERGNFEGLAGKRVGLVVNPASVDSRGVSTIEVLRNAPGVKLVALYGPEHGVYGKVKAGDYVPSQRDKATGLWIYSLYGDTRKPTPAMLKDVDVIVYDLQDIGCRSYTFISTLGLVMEAAAESGKTVVVLDRPNPLGGQRVEGPRLNTRFRSFVSQYDIPYVYGLTPGELAYWINDRFLAKPCNLKVVPMSGWTRAMTWDDTGLAWKPTSPNIPRFESIPGYVSTGLLGEIGVANGANDRYPFEVVAAEWLDADATASRINRLGLAGISASPYSFRPASGKYTSVTYRGARLNIDPKTPSNLTLVNYQLMDILRASRPSFDPFLKMSADKTLMFDKLNGTDAMRSSWRGGVTAKDLVQAWQGGVARWKAEWQRYWIYGRDQGPVQKVASR
jgi:uncharacterized protein YbbC (DUF1343 family)